MDNLSFFVDLFKQLFIMPTKKKIILENFIFVEKWIFTNYFRGRFVMESIYHARSL